MTDEDAASAAGGKRFGLRGELLRIGGDSAYGLCAGPGISAAPFGALRVAAVPVADVHGVGAAEPEARPG